MPLRSNYVEGPGQVSFNVRLTTTILIGGDKGGAGGKCSRDRQGWLGTLQ